MSGTSELDELLAFEIERRIGASGTAVDQESLRVLLHSLRGSVAMTGHTDLALVVSQLSQRLRQQEPNVQELAVEFLRHVVRRLRASLPPLETQWPVPPYLLVPSTVDATYRVDYRKAMLDRLNDLDVVIACEDPNHASLEQAYRFVHSLKSTASSFGDDTTAWYCHGLETRLRAALNDNQQNFEVLAQLARHSGAIARLLDDPDEAFIMLRALQPSHPARARSASPSVRPSAHPTSRPAPASMSDELDGELDAPLRVPQATVEGLFDHLEHVDVSAEELLTVSRSADELARQLRELSHELMAVRRATIPVLPNTALDDLSYRLEYVARQLQLNQLHAARIGGQCARNSEALRAQWAYTRAALSQLRRTQMTWLCERVENAAHRLAHGEGKLIAVHFTGGDIHLERNLAERLLEAVVQVVRNAVSHGIALPEARIAAGKPPHGHITLRAERQGDWLRLTVDDDGRGVNFQRVRQLAVERGVISIDAASQLSEHEFFGLLFLPGLSTRKDADILAGRGVGLDLAQDIMRRLGGTLRLSGLTTGGVRATFECPIERGLMDVVWLHVGDQQFALPVTFTGSIRPCDAKLPPRSLANCLGLPAHKPCAVELEIVVPGVHPIALAIDELGEVEEVIVRALPALLSTQGPYAGAVLRGDGTLRLVLDAAIIAADLWSHVRST